MPMLKKLRRFFKSIHFFKAIVTAIGMIIPVVITKLVFDDVQIGFSVSLGVLFCTPSDIPGSIKHKFLGIIASIILAAMTSFLIGTFLGTYIVLIPLLIILIFGISYLSVFGFRASLISFAGLLALVLTFAQSDTEVSVLMHTLLVMLGGGFYLVLTMLVQFALPKVQTDFLFVELFNKTSEFIKIRGKLLVEKEDRNVLFKQLFKLQTEINELHETMREVILEKRTSSGFSNRTRRQQLIFTKLIEVYELAISNTIDYKKIDTLFKEHQEKIDEFKVLIFEISHKLSLISRVILKEEKLSNDTTFEVLIKKIQNHIDIYRVEKGLKESRDGAILLLNYKAYQEKQIQNIIDIERVLNNYTKNDKIRGIKDAERFITPQDYDLKKLKANFSFDSPIFRHSLRLTVVMLVGFVLGEFIHLQKSYWILLTLVVIMRPSYGLTKERSLNRVVGTIIGALVGVGVILLTQNMMVYGVLAIVSLVIGFSLVKLNYRDAAAFITLYVIFLYAFIQPDVISVIKFRVIDTMTGASLAFVANYFLWPAWEVKNIKESFVKTIENNLRFLKEIDRLYHNKGIASTEFKLARKEAFLGVGNLNAAYQRLIQEPKSRQENLSEIYELVTINNTFLSSLSSLGMFIRSNKTGEVPKQFETYVEYIECNLVKSRKYLNGEISVVSLKNEKLNEATKIYEDYFQDLSNERDKEIDENIPVSDEMKMQLRETKLVSEQVRWLSNLSESLVKNVQLI